MYVEKLSYHYSDYHYVKIQIMTSKFKDHELSTDPDPKIGFERLLNTFIYRFTSKSNRSSSGVFWFEKWCKLNKLLCMVITSHPLNLSINNNTGTRSVDL